jgi:LysM repeat protein
VTEPPASEPTQAMTIYVVKPGDTFSSIARKFHLTRAQLLAANPQITNPNSITIGQRINIPVPASASPSSQPASAEPTDTPVA